MTSLKTVAALFENEPMRWGLRGDPYLWREMRLHFEQTPLPTTAEGLDTLIEAMFASLTDHSISEKEPFFIERFSHGGMSSGQISPDFWRDTIIPLMRARYTEI